MAALQFLKISPSVMTEPGMVRIASQLGAEGVGVAFSVAMALGSQPTGSYPIGELAALSWVTRIPVDQIRRVFQAAPEIFPVIDGVLTCQWVEEARAEVEAKRVQRVGAAQKSAEARSNPESAQKTNEEKKISTAVQRPLNGRERPNLILSSLISSNLSDLEGGTGGKPPPEPEPPPREPESPAQIAAAVDASLASVGEDPPGEPPGEPETPPEWGKFGKYLDRYLEAPNLLAPRPWQSGNLYILAGKRPFKGFPNVHVSPSEAISIFETYAERFPVKEERVRVLKRALAATESEAQTHILKRADLSTFNAYARLTSWKLADVVNAESAASRFNAQAERAAGGGAP